MSAGLEIRKADEKGVFFDRPDFKAIDTNRMDWEPGPPGEWIKVLERDDQGHPTTFIAYLPPGSAMADETGIELPMRHVHSNAHEHSFMLGGELPHAEYASPEQLHGDVYIKKPGVFMWRKPNSIHGLEKGLYSRTGATLLYWRSPGGGTYFGEENYEELSPHLPFEGRDPTDYSFNVVETPEDGVIFDRADFRAVDTNRMDWEPGPPGKFVKVLERDDLGYPCSFIAHIPPTSVMEGMPDLPFRHYHKSVWEKSFVLDGELPHWEYESPEDKRGTMYLKGPGTYMSRQPGSIHGLEAGITSRTGCTILYWRGPGGGTWVGEDNYHEESIDVPF